MKRDGFPANNNEFSLASFMDFASLFTHENATRLNSDNCLFTINLPYKMVLCGSLNCFCKKCLCE